MKLKVMTYNIFSGRTLDGSYDLEGKIETIREVNPDILGLNEVHLNTRHSNFTSQTDTLGDALDMPHRFFARAIDHNGGQYGIALLSRYPILSCECVPIPDSYDEQGNHPESRVHICATIDVNGKTIQVLTSHYGLSQAEQEHAVAETLRLKDASLPTIFMGDLNAQDTDAVMAPLFANFQDAACSLTGPDKLTFRSDKPTIRIDYIFHTPEFMVENVKVLPSTASDHRPVFAELEVN